MLDLGKAVYEFRKLDGEAVMVTTESGHIGFNILEQNQIDLGKLIERDWKPFLRSGGELCILEDGDSSGGGLIQGPSSTPTPEVSANHEVENLACVTSQQPAVQSQRTVRFARDLESDSHGQQDACPQEQEGLRRCLREHGLGKSSHPGSSDLGEAKADVSCSQTSQAPIPTACQLETVCEAGTHGDLRGPGHGVVRHGSADGHGLPSSEPRSVDCRDREVCIGMSGGRSDGYGHRGEAGTQVSGVWGLRDLPQESLDPRAILGMSSLSGMQGAEAQRKMLLAQPAQPKKKTAAKAVGPKPLGGSKSKQTEFSGEMDGNGYTRAVNKTPRDHEEDQVSQPSSWEAVSNAQPLELTEEEAKMIMAARMQKKK